MVGRSHLFDTVLQEVLQRMRPDDRYVWALLGEQGSGTRIVAKTFYVNAGKEGKFERLGWASVGRGYELKDVLIILIAQVEADVDDELLADASDDQLSEYLYKALEDRSYLIVLDGPLHHLRQMFSAIKGTILVTTRLPKVAKFERDDTAIEMQLLDEEQSWCLLRRRVFDGGECPPELEKVGRMIAKRCDGLPLLIRTVADQLSEVEQSESYWNDVASGKEKEVFKNAHSQISKALLPSYHNLPQHLKPCFLYI